MMVMLAPLGMKRWELPEVVLIFVLNIQSFNNFSNKLQLRLHKCLITVLKYIITIMYIKKLLTVGPHKPQRTDL